MPMIQPVDGNVLLNALRAGREDRFQDLTRQASMDKAKREEDRAAKYEGLMGNLFGGQQPAGVQGNFAPSNPKPTMDQAFAPEAMGAMERGEAPPAMAPPSQPMQAPARQSRQLDMGTLSQMMMLDPEQTSKLVSTLKTMDEVTLKRMETKNVSMGATAQWLSTQPEADRPQLMRMMAPQMLSAGWTEEELAQADLSNRALVGYQNQAMAMDDIIDNALAEREFMAGKTVPVTAGGNVALVKPEVDQYGKVTGTSQEYIVGGGGQPGDIPSPASKAEVDALPAGSRFRAPDGSIRTKPGGGVSNGTGGFPG